MSRLEIGWGKNEYHHQIVAFERIPIVDRIYKMHMDSIVF